MSSAEQFEKEAEQIITAELLRLPHGVQSGTARNLVRFLVDAAVARVAEQRAAEQQTGGGVEKRLSRVRKNVNTLG